MDVSQQMQSQLVHQPQLPMRAESNIGNLDIAMSTRAPASTALSTGQLTNTRASNIDRLDVTVSSRLAAASYTAPTTPPTSSALLTRSGMKQIAGHLSAGSTGLKLNSASAVAIHG